MPKFILLLINIGCFLNAFTQTVANDSNVFNKKGLLKIYLANTKANPLLFNGKQYLYNYRDIKGNPFLFGSEFLNGSVNYNGIYFSQARLSYDIVSDDLIVYPDSSNTGIVLQKYRVSSFEINNDRFIHLYQKNQDSINESLGFFRMLFYGTNMAAFIKYEKLVSDPGANSGEQRVLREKTSYFIQKNGKLYKIKGQASVLDMLYDKRELLKSFIKENDIDFKKNTESSLLKILSWYNQN